MANVKATMTDIRVIIRELSRGTSLREMERKLQLSRTSLSNYRDRAEATGRSMADLLSLNDAELQAIMQKGDGHRGRDADWYAFMHPPLQPPLIHQRSQILLMQIITLHPEQHIRHRKQRQCHKRVNPAPSHKRKPHNLPNSYQCQCRPHTSKILVNENARNSLIVTQTKKIRPNPV